MSYANFIDPTTKQFFASTTDVGSTAFTYVLQNARVESLRSMDDIAEIILKAELNGQDTQGVDRMGYVGTAQLRSLTDPVAELSGSDIIFLGDVNISGSHTTQDLDVLGNLSVFGSSNLTGANISGGDLFVDNSANVVFGNTTGVRIGVDAGLTQGVGAVAVGFNAGFTSQGNNGIAIGVKAGLSGQDVQGVAIGYEAGETSQGQSAVAIGDQAGQGTQGAKAVGVGFSSGFLTQGASAVAIGDSAGYNGQNPDAVAIGTSAGYTGQGAEAISIGKTAGGTSAQGAYAIAIGSGSGSTSQGQSAVAIGQGAGAGLQGADAIAIGSACGAVGQSANAVAIGNGSANGLQGVGAVAIGYQSGAGSSIGMGDYSIAIGYQAGDVDMSDNSIILNATGAPLGSAGGAGCFMVAPIRGLALGLGAGRMFYDSSTGEVQYSTT